MVAVTLWGSLSAAVEGKTTLDIEASDIRELFRKLEEQYPGLKSFMDKGIAVAVDGVIYRDAWSKKLPKDSEVFLLPRIAGG